MADLNPINDPAFFDKAARSVLQDVVSKLYTKSDSVAFNQPLVAIENHIDNMEAHTADLAKDYANQIEELSNLLNEWQSEQEIEGDLFFDLPPAFQPDQEEDEDEQPVSLIEVVSTIRDCLNKVIELT